MPTHVIPFNVLLSPDDKKRLRQIAKLDGSSMGQVIRHSITAAFLHQCRAVPCCADGSRCKAPHLAGPATPPMSADLLKPDDDPDDAAAAASI